MYMACFSVYRRFVFLFILMLLLENFVKTFDTSSAKPV